MASVKSKIIRIILNVTPQNGDPQKVQYEVEYFDNDNGFHRHLPKIDDPLPTGSGMITAELGTDTAATIGYIKYHRHNPECITIEIGGAQYQVCWP